MSSWFSNALSATSKGITNLKSSLLGSEADGDTEDDTHVCRVLRGYYIENGRPFPPWLPPDPKASAPVIVAQAPSFASSSRYGGLNQSQGSTTAGSGGAGSGSGLSSLWDTNSSASQQQQGSQSLRAGAGRARQGAPSPFANMDNSNRPNIPSQRSYGPGSTPPGSSGGVSTADKLRQRFIRGAAGGARTTSPANQSAFAPPPSQQAPTSGGYSRAGGGDYEDRFAPGGMYDNGGGGGGRGGGGGGGGGGRQGGGLPSGPRRGLPSGPRMR